MPGYGFAKAPKDVVKKWRFLINDYLRGRQVLKRALVLVDSIQLLALDSLEGEPGAVSAVGRSLQIRLRTHARLAERAARTRSGASA
mgnify:CR=1 FL=1